MKKFSAFYSENRKVENTQNETPMNSRKYHYYVSLLATWLAISESYADKILCFIEYYCDVVFTVFYLIAGSESEDVVYL